MGEEDSIKNMLKSIMTSISSLKDDLKTRTDNLSMENKNIEKQMDDKHVKVSGNVTKTTGMNERYASPSK